MNHKQFVAAWYGGVAIVITLVIGGRQAAAYAGLLAVILFLLLVFVLRGSGRPRQTMDGGTGLLVGLFIVGLLLAGWWRADVALDLAARASAIDFRFTPRLLTPSAKETIVVHTPRSPRSTEHGQAVRIAQPRRLPGDPFPSGVFSSIPATEVEVSHVEYRDADGLVGELHNRSNFTLARITIHAEVRDHRGAVVDRADIDIDAEARSGETKPFRNVGRLSIPSSTCRTPCAVAVRVEQSLGRL